MIKGAFRQNQRQEPWVSQFIRCEVVGVLLFGCSISFFPSRFDANAKSSQQSSTNPEDAEPTNNPLKVAHHRNKSRKKPFGFGRRTPSTLPILGSKQQRNRKYRGYDDYEHEDGDEDWISFSNSEQDDIVDQDDDHYPWDPLWKQQHLAHKSTTTSPLTASQHSSLSYSSKSRREDLHDNKYWVQLPHETELEREDKKRVPSRTVNGDDGYQHAVLFSNIHMMPVQSLQEKSKTDSRKVEDTSPSASRIAKRISFEEEATPAPITNESMENDVDESKADSGDLASPSPLIPTTSFSDIIRASRLASFWDELMQNNDSSLQESKEETDRADESPCPAIRVKSIECGTHEVGPPPPVLEVVHHRRNNSDASDVSSLAFPDISRKVSPGGDSHLSLLSSLACSTLGESPVYSISSMFQKIQDSDTTDEASSSKHRESSRRHRDFNLEQGRRHLEYNLSSGKRAMTKESMAVSEILLRDLEQANQYNNEIESIPDEDGRESPYPSSDDRLENRFGLGTPSSTEQESDMAEKRLTPPNASKHKCLVLLMEPETKIFELVRVPYQPEETTLADLLRLVRREATDERLARQTYTGLAHEGMHITAPMVPIDLILTAKVASQTKEAPTSKKTASAPVLLAVPTNYSATHVESMAEKLLASRKVHRLLAMDHYKSASVQLPTKTAQKLSNHHRRRHLHRHQSTKDVATGAASGNIASSGPATTVNAPTLGQQVVTWATLNYGSRIKGPSYPEDTAM